MTRAVPTLLVAAASLCVACGGAGTEPAPAPGPAPAAATAGGEAEPARIERPLRTTVPVPVPQPAVAREDLSESLQRVWTGVEEAVAVRPPRAPAEATAEAVEAWSEGPFRDWLDERGAAMRATVGVSEDVPEEPPHERAVASALLGYALEDLVADVRGAPLPAEIAEDPELLEIYVENLMEVLRPMALEAVISYAYCQRRLAALGDDSEWLPWRAYCVQRGREVIETYELSPDEMQPPEPAEDPPADEPAPTSARDGLRNSGNLSPSGETGTGDTGTDLGNSSPSGNAGTDFGT